MKNSVILFLVLILPCFAADSVSKKWIKRGRTMLEREEPDSAFLYFQNAHRNGLSNDSLYYYWAETFLQKGVYDTALALNYVSGNSGNPELRKLLLRQRYQIFYSLGWNDEANEVLDSLRDRADVIKDVIIPEIGLSADLGYGRVQERYMESYPYRDTVEKKKFVDDNRYEGAIGGDISWEWSVFNAVSIKPGLNVSIDKSSFETKHTNEFATSSGYVPGNEVSFGDSIGYTIGASMTIAPQPGFLSVAHEWKRRFDKYENLNYSNDFGITTFFAKSKWITLFSGTYGFTIGDNPGKNFSIMGYLAQTVPQKKGFTIQVQSFGLLAQPFEYDTSIYFPTMYIDGFAFYNDSTFTGDGVVPVSDIQIVSLAKEEKYRIVQSFPQSMINSFSSVSYRWPFGNFLEGGITLGWGWRRFLGNYRWQDFRHSIDDLVNGDFKRIEDDAVRLDDNIIVVKKDGTKYLLKDTDFANQSLQLVPVREYNENRIDNRLEFTFSLKKTLNRVGTFQFTNTVGRTFSTLHDEAPITIPRWSYTVSLSWNTLLRFRSEHL